MHHGISRSSMIGALNPLVHLAQFKSIAAICIGAQALPCEPETSRAHICLRAAHSDCDSFGFEIQHDVLTFHVNHFDSSKEAHRTEHDNDVGVKED